MIEAPKWLAWAREIYSLSQSGLTYSGNDYDIQRYKRLQAITVEMMASQSLLSEAEISESFSMQSGYATPKIDVRGAVIRDGQILLVRERADGRWAMPGGWADIGDAPAAMVAREVWEESGFRVRTDRLVAVFDNNRLQPSEFYHIYKLIFLCSIQGGEAKTSLETLDVGFFGMDDLPPLSEARTNRKMLAEVFAHHHDPARPAYFE